ncbi:hypothetical protein LR48_Vigan04g061400 [Vigna angularis]|uniref:Uncharacterized protein n=1 Tax=Phaseolus angularis TaxID=3914 RepID=A0A0L9UCH5_PHAAN|nr:hypothetical protein LR48_Vigan04g061400 [Vigna angularis]
MVREIEELSLPLRPRRCRVHHRFCLAGNHRSRGCTGYLVHGVGLEDEVALGAEDVAGGVVWDEVVLGEDNIAGRVGLEDEAALGVEDVADGVVWDEAALGEDDVVGGVVGDEAAVGADDAAGRMVGDEAGRHEKEGSLTRFSLDEHLGENYLLRI